MHVHCYRCDSPETASIMHANLQLLIGRPETQRAILDLEQRLFLSGFLVPRPPPRRVASGRPAPAHSTSSLVESVSQVPLSSAEMTSRETSDFPSEWSKNSRTNSTPTWTFGRRAE